MRWWKGLLAAGWSLNETAFDVWKSFLAPHIWANLSWIGENNKIAFLLHDEIALVELHLKYGKRESLVVSGTVGTFGHLDMTVVSLLTLHDLLATFLQVNVLSRHDVVVRFFCMRLLLILNLSCWVRTHLRIRTVCFWSILFFRATWTYSVGAMCLHDLFVHPRVCL